MKIYIDFDDVICETAKAFTSIAKELFDIDLPYSQVQFFNLQKTFDLDDDQYEKLMQVGHYPEKLLSYENYLIYDLIFLFSLYISIIQNHLAVDKRFLRYISIKKSPKKNLPELKLTKIKSKFELECVVMIFDSCKFNLLYIIFSTILLNKVIV